MASPSGFTCPACGADVHPNAVACPECGADERSGWRDDHESVDDLSAAGIPDDQGMKRGDRSSRPVCPPTWRLEVDRYDEDDDLAAACPATGEARSQPVHLLLDS